MSADTWFSGDRTKSNFVYHWQHELAKLPPAGVSWEWDDVVGESLGKVAYKCAYRMRSKGCIVEAGDGLYRTGEELERYLRDNDVCLESWRSCLTEDDAAIVIDGHGRVARWVDGRCECVECSEPFGTELSARMHWTRLHASQERCEAAVTRGSQATLDEFERIDDSMQCGVDGQARLVV